MMARRYRFPADNEAARLRRGLAALVLALAGLAGCMIGGMAR